MHTLTHSHMHNYIMTQTHTESTIHSHSFVGISACLFPPALPCFSPLLTFCGQLWHVEKEREGEGRGEERSEEKKKVEEKTEAEEKRREDGRHRPLVSYIFKC